MTEALGMSATIISSFTGGLIIQEWGLLWLANLNLLLLLINIVYMCALRESYTPPTPPPPTTTLTTKLLEPLKLFAKRAEDENYRTKLLLLFTSFFVSYLQLIGFMTIALLYLFHSPLSFDVTNAGYVDAEGNAAMFFGAYFVSYVLVRRLRWLDTSVMLLGAIMNGLFAMCVGISRTHLQIFLAYLLKGKAMGL